MHLPLKDPTLDELLDKYGILHQMPDGPADISMKALDELALQSDEEDLGGLLHCLSGKAGREAQEIGKPGTPIIGGRIDIEPNWKFRPYQVRGYLGDSGLYEEYYRGDPNVFSGINAKMSLAMVGDVEVQPPKDVPKVEQSAMDEYVRWSNRWLHGIKGGLPRHIKHAMSALQFGFAMFETVWTTDRLGRWHPIKYGFREPLTLEWWVMNDRQDELVATQHQTYGDGTDRYLLPAQGPHPLDRRVMLNNIYARGNNFEGISLIRPIIRYIQMKQLLVQIAGVTAKKYGVPVTQIMVDPSILNDRNSPLDMGDVKKLYQTLKDLWSVEGGVYTIPEGLRVSVEGAKTTMPSLQDFIEMCDQQIAKTLDNETSLLGLHGVGSYNLAEVKDAKELRGMGYYTHEALDPINEQLRWLAEWHGLRFSTPPRAVWRMDGFADESKWIDDVTRAMGGLAMDQWPENMQQAALQKFSLPPDTFEEFERPANDDRVERPPMVQGVELSCSHAQDRLDFSGAATVELSAEDERHIIQWARMRPDVELKTFSGIDPEEAEREMDDAEERMAERFSRLAREHQARWREVIRDPDVENEEMRLRLIEQEFRPRYRDIVREELERVQREAIVHFFRSQGLQVEDASDFGENEALRAALEKVVINVGDTAFNRTHNHMLDASIERSVGSSRQGVPRLKTSTYRGIAATAVTIGYNAGRDRIFQRVKEEAEAQEESGRMLAKRSSMLDNSTCEKCLKLDFERGSNPAVHVVGTRAYYRDMPPNHCEGGRRCRCVYIIEMPESWIDAAQRVVMDAAA